MGKFMGFLWIIFFISLLFCAIVVYLSDNLEHDVKVVILFSIFIASCFHIAFRNYFFEKKEGKK